MSTTTYLTLTNKTIRESGADLDLFATDGSDWDLTGHDPLMYQFQTWVARAWQTVQQEAYDWEFMSGQAVVTLSPGIMFYTKYPINSYDIEYDATIYDFDGTVLDTEVPVTSIVKLSGEWTDNLNYGFVNLASDNTFPITFTLKSGGNYFFAPSNLTLDYTSTSLSIVVVGAAAIGTPLSTVGWTAQDAYGNHFSDTVDVAGTVAVAPATDRFEAKITGGLGEWWRFSFSDALQNPLFTAVMLVVTMANGCTVSVVPGAYATHSTVALTQTPIPYITYPSTVNIGLVGNGWNVAGGITTNTLIDSVVIANSLTGNGTYVNAGDVTYFNTGGGGSKVYLDITNATLLAAIGGVGASFGQTVTITFKSGGVTKGILSKAWDNTLTFWEYFPTITDDPGKMNVHSWKSYDWGEETNEDDFVEDVAEIDQQSFRIVYHEDPTPSTEIKLTFVPWDLFRVRYDNANQPPAQPRVVTEDNTGRWKFYPALDRPYTMLFDYVRNPHQVTDFDDTFRRIPNDMLDIVMWRAMMYYGEYDEQPSVQARATRNYKDLLFRMELRYREKFHFKSAFNFGGWS